LLYDSIQALIFQWDSWCINEDDWPAIDFVTITTPNALDGSGTRLESMANFDLIPSDSSIDELVLLFSFIVS